MKAKTNIILIFVALAYWLGLCNASAFYDPGQQRWLNRDPIGEQGFEVVRWKKASIERHSNLYEFVNNNPLEHIDYFGLSASETLLESFWESIKAGADLPGDAASLFEIFGNSCNTLGLVLAYAETKYKDCLTDALLGAPSCEGTAEAACKAAWSDKIGKLKDLQNKECKGK